EYQSGYRKACCNERHEHGYGGGNAKSAGGMARQIHPPDQKHASASENKGNFNSLLGSVS
ncbi:hypothetical protein, partial [Immundisolibacter sp.]